MRYMAICPDCKKQVQDGSAFCDNCGAKIPETVFCTNCGEQISTTLTKCPKCGTSLIEKFSDEENKKKCRKSFPIKLLLSGVGIMAVVLLLIVTMTPKENAEKNYGMYIKNGEIFYTDFSAKKEPLQISEHLNGEISYYSYQTPSIGSLIEFVKDGNLIIYPGKQNEYSQYSLYHRNIKKPDEAAVKIDDNIESYRVNDAEDRITYVSHSYEDDTKVLYQYNMQNKEKIGSSIDGALVSKDGQKIIYGTTEGDIYIWYADKDRVKVASDVQIVAISGDVSVVYYLDYEELTLYKYEENVGKTKITSGIEGTQDIKAIYDTGEIYYTKTNYHEGSLMDFVEDDMAAKDATLQRPHEPEKPYYSSWRYDSEEEYEIEKKQYETDYQLYQEEKETYDEKFNRDTIRNILKNETRQFAEHKLYYYDGEKETEVNSNYSVYQGEYDLRISYLAINPAANHPGPILRMIDSTNIPRIKMSEISVYAPVSSADIAGKIQNEIETRVTQQAVIKGHVISFEEEQTSACGFSSNGDQLYLLSNNGDLYQTSISNGKVGKLELCDNDVEKFGMEKNGMLLYYKDIGDNTGYGDLYDNKQVIDYDVFCYETYYDKTSESYFYYTDWNRDKLYGTLKCYQNGTVTKIADDVYGYSVLSDGSILYVYDCDENTCEGTLYRYQNGEVTKVDENVSAILSEQHKQWRAYYL